MIDFSQFVINLSHNGDYTTIAELITESIYRKVFKLGPVKIIFRQGRKQ